MNTPIRFRARLAGALLVPFVLLATGAIGFPITVPEIESHGLWIGLWVVDAREGDALDPETVKGQLEVPGDPDLEGFALLASLERASTYDYPNRLELPDGSHVEVTILERSGRRVRARVRVLRGDDRHSEIVQFRLDRSTRPARGTLAIPLAAQGRWLRLSLRRP